jgi:hypothetical protein
MNAAGLKAREIEILTKYYNLPVLLDKDTGDKNAKSVRTNGSSASQGEKNGGQAEPAKSMYDHLLQSEIANELGITTGVFNK